MLFSRFLGRSHATPAAYAAKRLPIHSPRAFHASAILRLLDMEKVNTSDRLAELRKLMKEHQVDVYSTQNIPRPHQTLLLSNRSASGSF